MLDRFPKVSRRKPKRILRTIQKVRTGQKWHSLERRKMVDKQLNTGIR
jgi:hypothetical protein